MSKRFSVAGLALVLLATLVTPATQLADKPKSTVEATSALSATAEVLTQVSQLRGLPVKRAVKSGFKTKLDIEKMLLTDFNDSKSHADLEASRKVLIKLGMIPRDFALRDYIIKLLTEQIAGFYEPKSKEFYLADWIPLAEQRTIMAHELTHALQDQYFDLGRFEHYPKHQSDSELAVHALIEGEATVVMLSWQTQLDITKLPPLDASGGNSSGGERYPIFEQAPLIIRENIVFPYFYGAAFVQSVLKSTSWQTITDSYRNLPLSTEQIMHPQKFLTRDYPVGIKPANLSKLLEPDWQQIDNDVTGEFNYRLMLEQFIDKRKAQQAAAGWGGDRYVAFEHRQTGEILLAQVTVWDTAADAKEFFTAYQARTEMRYNKLTNGEQTAELRQWHSPEGDITIQLRGDGVLVLEGGQAARHKELAAALWQSERKPVTAIPLEKVAKK